MDQVIVTHLNGSTFKLQSKENVSKITAMNQNVELLGADTIDITVESAKKLTFLIGDKITVIGRVYTLNLPAKEQKISESHFVYDAQFEGVQYDMLRAGFNVNIDTTSNIIQDLNGDSLTGDVKRFLDVLIANLNRVFPDKWVLGTYPETTETITETFGESDNCLSVLQSLCGEDKYNTEFSITTNGSGVHTLNVGATGTTHTYTFQYGKGKGIYGLTRQKVNSSNIITRLHVYGGSRNISTQNYRASKLCLPGKNKAQSYIENQTAIDNYGIWESTKNFEKIYPRRTGTISALCDSTVKFIDSSMDFDLTAKWENTSGDYNLYVVTHDYITFETYQTSVVGNSKYLLSGSAAKVYFNTGKLAGYEFDVNAYDHATKQFTIVTQTDENDFTFPSENSMAFQFAAGDKYVLINIYMPQTYIDNAETEVQTAGQAHYNKYSQPLVSYGLTVDSFFLKDIVGADAESNIIWAGDYIPILDTDLNVDKTIRVKGFTRDLLKDYSYNLTIADIAITVSTTTRIITDLDSIDKIIRINDLKNPARARRNWLNAQEVLGLVFDTEGDYYAEKIKPLSIDTTMLSVGAKSMQFGLEGTIFQVNYGGAKNRIVYVGGTITHYTVLDANSLPRSWNITGGDVTLATDGAYYVYVKCARIGSGASILFSTTKITVESDGAYYHFLIGVINSVGTDNERAFALMYGFTTINGRFIKTGRIQSADGITYFDLDAGEFRGVFKFSNGNSIEDTINGIKIGGRNYIRGTGLPVLNVTGWTGTGWTGAKAIDTAENALSFTVDSGWYSLYYSTGLISQQVTISFDAKWKQRQGSEEFWICNGTDGYYGEFLKIITITTGAYTKNTHTFMTDASGRISFTFMDIDAGPEYVGELTDIALIKNLKLEIGNKATDWTMAPEDITGGIDGKPNHFVAQPVPPYRVGDFWSDTNVLLRCKTTRLTGSFSAADWEDATKYDNTKTVIDGGLVTSGTIQVAGDLETVLAGMTGNGVASSAIRFWAGSTYVNRGTAPFRVQQDGTVVMTKGVMTNADVEGIIKATSGHIGDWTISGQGITNISDSEQTAYIIARLSGLSGFLESRIGSNIMPASTGVKIPAWFQSTIQNADFSNTGKNIALLLTAAHAHQNHAIMATGDIMLVNGDAVSSKLNYMNLYNGSLNVISISKGLKVHTRNASGSTQTLFLPSMSGIRSDLGIATFSVTSAAAVSSTTATVYYVAKGNYLYIGDAIKYGSSGYQTIVDIDRYSSATMDAITVETTLGVAVLGGGIFTAIHEFSVAVTIIIEGSEVPSAVNCYPNGGTWYDNNGGAIAYLALGRGDVIKVVAYTRRNIIYYQSIGNNT